ncbi:hypothetical protein SISSUDRAFT_626712 [Sistotremastrum suecicum HHB10207 ss-3]|uniref:Uncharacterized protein n=1 Tax=Sistotremastrum suecicum HHB10207 ss-3 TaxID=1314776 RepID=A0A165XAB5_9AGAM|nr:hypothetical protein SISSUDRAFT_626712 [Sistotremastrum suecicum HHB10207 ss-3]
MSLFPEPRLISSKMSKLSLLQRHPSLFREKLQSLGFQVGFPPSPLAHSVRLKLMCSNLITHKEGVRWDRWLSVAFDLAMVNGDNLERSGFTLKADRLLLRTHTQFERIVWLSYVIICDSASSTLPKYVQTIEASRDCLNSESGDSSHVTLHLFAPSSSLVAQQHRQLISPG